MDMQGGGYKPGEAAPVQHVRLAGGGGTAAPLNPAAVHHRDDLLVGEVIDISGSSSRILLDAAALRRLSESGDPAVAMAGQVGAQIKVRVGNVWLLASIRDQQFVKAAMPEGARGFIDSIPALRNRECIICGEGVSIPIRVYLDTLAEEKRPASSDPLFSKLWRETGGESEILDRVVKRWRSQGR